MDIGSPVVRMAYSPTAGHSLVAVLEVSILNSFFIDDVENEIICDYGKML